jgi:hypothetical protein
MSGHQNNNLLEKMYDLRFMHPQNARAWNLFFVYQLTDGG